VSRWLLTARLLPPIFDAAIREEGIMTKLHRFALAVSLVPLVSFMAAGRSESADAAGCTKNDDCDDNNPCTKDKCDQDAGQCEFKPHDFGNHYGQPITCDDGNACTSADVCHAGVCAGANVPDDTACNDGDACTRSDSCQSGACTGANPVVCSASDQCHEAGTCDPASGVCSDPAAPDGTACTDIDSCSGPDVCDAGVCGYNGNARHVITFGSSRDAPADGQFRLEVYLMNEDFTNQVRLTNNTGSAKAWWSAMPALSPDGKGRIIFDSSRNRIPGVDKINVSDLFIMQADGSDQTFVTRGSSASWSPDSQSIAFHRSASGTGLTIRVDLGAPTSDSDIFVAKVCDLLAGVPPTNITNSPTEIDDDASWSPDGQKILWTAHNVGDDPLVIPSQDIYVMNADGSGRVNLTHNFPVEERGPSWSPDGTRIAYMCRIGLPPEGMTTPTFEICVMNADGSDVTRLTNNTLPDGTPTWSSDGTKIVFNRAVPPPNQQLHIMNADGSGQRQITDVPGFNLFGSFGEVKDGR
jgi:Tol biopolymer transport system component